MAKKKLILIGGGGYCKSAIDVIESTDEYKIIGIVDKNLAIGDEVMDYTVIGNDHELANLLSSADYAIVTINHIKTASTRKYLFNSLIALGYKIPAIGASRSYVSKHASIGIGTIIFHHAMINAHVKIGQNCIINTNALIEHDVVIGSNTHISTSATVNGNSIIGECCFIGSNAVINNNINICDNVIIGSGSVVIRDINEPGTYAGVPVINNG